MLILAVPNVEGSVAKTSKEHWFANDVPRHLFHFSPQTMAIMLEETGFKIDKISTMSLEQDIFGFAQSMLNLSGFPYNIFYDFIRSPQARLRHSLHNENKYTDVIQQITIFILGSFFCFIGLPIAILSASIGMGGTLEIWAKPFEH
jgi:hypothetical protein